MTYGAVLFTLLVQGLTIAPFVRRLGLLHKTSQSSSSRVDALKSPRQIVLGVKD